VPMAGLGAELMRQQASKGFNYSDPCTLIEMYQTNQVAAKQGADPLNDKSGVK